MRDVFDLREEIRQLLRIAVRSFAVLFFQLEEQDPYSHRDPTKVFKKPLYNPLNMMPWNSQWNVSSISSVLGLASHPYFKALFDMNFTTYILVAYRWGAPTDPSMEFCNNLTQADFEDSTVQFAALTAHLMATYAGTGKRFIYQHWEGDWAARCGNQNEDQPADPSVQARMVQWLSARQAGTNAGRSTYCEAAYPGLDCSLTGHKLLMQTAGVEVYHASEVNLVAASITGNFPNNILGVIPHVALDMVSYSSYETEQIHDNSEPTNPGLGQALDFIAAHHNATPASPSPSVYIGEYGSGLNQGSLSKLQNLTMNVVGYALSKGPTGVQRAAHAMFWQLYDNDDPFQPTGRCTAATGPDFNASHMDGFWLVEPGGTPAQPAGVYTWAYGYLQGVINGSIPVPTV